MDINYLLFAAFLLIILQNIVVSYNSNRRVAIRLFANHYINLKDCLSFALLLFLIIVAITDNDNPDYYNYQVVYNTSTSTILDTDIGYSFVMNCARKVGWSFETFHAVIYTFFYILLWISLVKLKLNKNIAIGLYALFPFAYDAIQIRFFCATCIMLYSLSFLMDKKTGGIIKYLIGIIVAATFHSLAIFYILFLFVRIEDSNKNRQTILRIAFAASCIAMMVSLFSDSFRNIFVYIFSLSTSSRKFNYYNQGVNWRNVFILAVQELMFFYASKINKDIAFSYDNQDKTRYREISTLLYGCNLAVCCTLPLLMVSQNFHRIYRNIYILNYGMFTLSADHNVRDQRNVFVISLITLGFFSSLFWNYFQDGLDVLFVLFN